MEAVNKFKNRRHDDYRNHKGWQKRLKKFLKQYFGFEK